MGCGLGSSSGRAFVCFRIANVLLQALDLVEVAVTEFAMKIGAVAGRVLQVPLQALLGLEGLFAGFASNSHYGVGEYTHNKVDC